MLQERQEYFYENFPNVFRKKIPIECQLGWFSIIFDLCKGIDKEIERLKKNTPECLYELIFPIEIKEKYGTLRFYMNTETDKISELIELATEKSAEICEFCGEKGGLRQIKKNWFQTLCNNCYENYIMENENG